ncbi:TolC family protein [Singulisphaera sp. PoT]|uniref:TolC family protein n=1 Tax=Singulisphaera sp. PoT TaxID=3411797 RepID=UPI003BF58C83
MARNASRERPRGSLKPGVMSALCAMALCDFVASGCVSPSSRKVNDLATSAPAYKAKVADSAAAPAPIPRPLSEKTRGDGLVRTQHEQPAAGSTTVDEALPALPDPLPPPSRPGSVAATGEADPPEAVAEEARVVTMIAAVPPGASEYAIDLTTSLRLAEVENPQIAEARQRIGEALAVLQGARALLLPDLNIGMNLHQHTGNLQRSSGTVLKLNESSLYFGGGADVAAAGTVEIPAISIYSSLTDAYFRPLAARQQVDGTRFQASATANRILLEVAGLHFELLAAEADLRVRRETASQGAEVARLTRAYASSGQGREADAERATTELRLVELEVREAEQGVAVASARLAHRLHLDQTVRIKSAVPRLEAISLIDPETPLPNLVQIALAEHPEIGAKSAELAAAETRHRQEIYRPLLPTLLLGYSGGAFGGGSDLVGTQLSHFAGRTDFDVQVFWTLSNMGFGNLAMIKQRQAEVGQADGDRARTIAEVRSTVAEAFAEVAAAKRRIEVTTKQLASAEEGFREDVDRIRNTVGRPIEVVNSLQLLNRARVDRIRAITDYNKAEFRLFVALGSPPPLSGPADTPLPPAPIATPLLPPLASNQAPTSIPPSIPFAPPIHERELVQELVTHQSPEFIPIPGHPGIREALL